MTQVKKTDDIRMNLASHDAVGDRLAELRAVFPEAFVEGKFDLERLRQYLGDFSHTGTERYGLTWAGKAEAIISALFNLALTAATFNTSGRRLQLWSKVASFPALFIQSTGTYYPPREARGLPPKRTITAELWVYTDVGKDPNANPEQGLNNIIDAIETALAPTIVGGVQTLGGLVSHAWIEGEIEQFPGVLDGIAKAIIPVKILIP